MTRLYERIQSPITGIELSPNEGNWSVILPEETTNLITNPSFELSFDGWTTPLSTIVAYRTNFRSRRGAWSAVVSTDPNNIGDAANSHYIETTITGWTAGRALTVSADGWTNSFDSSNKANRIGVVIDAVETLSDYISQELTWERVSVTVSVPSTAVAITVRLYLGQQVSLVTDVIRTTYWDGVQAEQKGYATTYTDGDQAGLIGEIAPYRWLGLPHASKSKRNAKTKSGGKLVNFNDVDFRIMSYTGASFTGFDDISLNYALTEGEYYQRTIATARTLTLSGYVCGSGQSDLQCKITDLQDLLKPNVANQNGQLLLRYTSCDCEEELQLLVTYVAGVEGNYTNHWQQNFAIRFKAHQPFFLQDGVQGAALNWVQSHSGFLRIMRQNEDGEWSQIDNATITGLGGDLTTRALEWVGSELFFSLRGLWQLDIDDNETQWQSTSVRYFIARKLGGFYTMDFFPFGGIVITDQNFVWFVDSAGSFVAIGEWTNDQDGNYSVLAEDRFGNLYIGGNRGDVRRWDGTTYPLGAPVDTDSTWPLVVDQITGIIKQIAFDVNNQMYLVGDFSTPFGANLSLTTQKNIDFQAKPTATPQTLGEFDFDGVLVDQTPGTPPTLIFCARVSRIPDGLDITTYTWSTNYAATTYVGECVTFTLTEPGGWTEPAVEIYLTLTLDDGSTARKTYHYRPETDPDTGDIEYQAITSLDTGQVLETLKLDLKPDYCIVTTEEDICEGEQETQSAGVDDDDPVVSWLWENSLDATTSTDEEATFTLSPALGQTFTITLTSITQSGESNQNVLTVEYIDGELLIISQTDNVTSYTLTFTNPNFRPYTNLIYLSGGQWIDFGETVGVTNDIVFDGATVYIGGEYGVKKFDGGSLNDIGQLGATVIKLEFKNGILYALTTQNAWRFNGSVWQPLGLTYPVGAELTDISVNDVGEVAVSANLSNGFMSSSTVTEIVYNGTVEARPAFEIVGPGRLWYITNRTTNRTVYIDYTLQDAEILTIELEQGFSAISSNIFGALSFLPGSRTDWYMADGANLIELWMTETNSDTSATMVRRLKFHSTDGLCCGLDEEERFDYTAPALCCDNDPALAIQKVQAPYPPGCDTGYNVGSFWIDTSTGKVYIRQTV